MGMERVAEMGMERVAEMAKRNTGTLLKEDDPGSRACPSCLEVWFVAAEAAPYMKVGGLADVAGELPRALLQIGVRMRLCMPLHGNMPIPADGVDSLPLDVPAEDGLEPCTVFSWVDHGLPVQAYDLPRWFGRERVYGYPDDGERYAAFCLAVAAHAVHHGNSPSILHLNDWHAAPLAMLVKCAPASGPGASLRQIRTLLTLHSMEYQGVARPSLADRFGLGTRVMGEDGAAWHGGFNALKSGIAWADAINTVSPTYAREILRPGNGFGLESFLARRVRDLPPSLYAGILNRLDKTWDPALDMGIAERYTDRSLPRRRSNSAALRNELCMPEMSGPVAAYVGRLVHGKGVSLLMEAAPILMAEGLQLVILGAGDPEFQEKLTAMAAAHPGYMSFRYGFDALLAHRIYAGADMLIMPSLRESCGLSQQIAMRYGCLPVVRKTGGLADTVADGDNGFVFTKESGSALIRAMRRATRTFSDRARWEEMMRNAMRTDSSWESSAKAYIRLYSDLMGKEMG